MIRICYSPPNQLEISGGSDDFQMVRQILLDLATAQAHKTAEISADPAFDPSPYDQALSKLYLRVGQGPTNITLQDDFGVHVEGSPDNLERLASFFDFGPDVCDGLHQHYEYFEGNAYIAPGAIPVVLHLRHD
jgi:hypothetical protein